MYNNLRIQPSLFLAFAILIIYMFIFSSIWVINDVDYKTIGKTIESTKLHYAMPTIISSIVVAILLSVFGWWRVVLFDEFKSAPKWMWIGVIAMIIISIINFSTVNINGLSTELILYSILGGIGVGFGEEVITRGSMLVGLRSRNLSENKIWLYSSLIFASIHIPNVFFGSPLYAMLTQLVFAFIMGSFLYIARRLSGTLLLPMFLHGFWDSSVFLPGAVGAKPSAYSVLIYPIAVVCIIVFYRNNKASL